MNKHSEKIQSVVFSALANAKRRQIIHLLEHGEQPATDLANSLGLSKATVSVHMATLL